MHHVEKEDNNRPGASGKNHIPIELDNHKSHKEEVNEENKLKEDPTRFSEAYYLHTS